MRQQTVCDLREEAAWRRDRREVVGSKSLYAWEAASPGRSLSAGGVRCSQTYPSPPSPPRLSEQHQGCWALTALECLPGPSWTALASRRQMFVREWQGPAPVAHGSTGDAGENGCSRYSPSVLINFILSSMLIIDNLVGSRPSFLTASCKLLQNAQQLTLVSLRKQNNTPSKNRKNNNKQKPKLIPA